MNNNTIRPVDGHNNLVRNMNNGAVINTDTAGARAFRAKRERELAEKARIDNLESRLDRIEQLLMRLVDGKSSLV